MSSTISTVFIVYNQADLLEKSLKSIGDSSDQVVIADLSSQDDIAKIAKNWGATYHKLPYTEVVEAVRQQIFDRVKSDYILYLDADESLPPGLLPHLRQLLSRNPDYISIPRKNYIFGSWVKASRWWPDYQVRFFKKAAVKWPTKLHHQPIVHGDGIVLTADTQYAILHQNYQNIDEWFEKNRRYARVDAMGRLKRHDSYTIFDAARLSVSELISRYFAGHGYRDGMHGLILSILQSFYYFLVYAYYWEGNKYQVDEPDEKLISLPRVWFSHGLSEIIHWDTKGASPAKKIYTKLLRKIIS